MYAFNRALLSYDRRMLGIEPHTANIKGKESNTKKASNQAVIYFHEDNLSAQDTTSGKSEVSNVNPSGSEYESKFTSTKKGENKLCYINKDKFCAGMVLTLAELVLKNYIKYTDVNSDAKVVKSFTTLNQPEFDSSRHKLVFMETDKNIAGSYIESIEFDLNSQSNLHNEPSSNNPDDPLSKIKDKKLADTIKDYQKHYNTKFYEVYNVVANTGCYPKDLGRGLQHSLRIMDTKKAPYLFLNTSAKTHAMGIIIIKKENGYKIYAQDPDCKSSKYYKKALVKIEDIDSESFVKGDIFDSFNSHVRASEFLSIEFLICKFDSENTRLLTGAGLDKIWLPDFDSATSLQDKLNTSIDILLGAAVNNNLPLLKWLKSQIDNDKANIIIIMGTINWSKEGGKRSSTYENYGTACLINAIKLKFFDIVKFLVNEFGVSVIQEGVPSIKCINQRESGWLITTASKEVNEETYDHKQIKEFIQAAAIKENLKK